MLHWGGKPVLSKITSSPEPAWLLGSRAFVNFFSIYFRLPIDTKYLKCYLYIIINNKTKKQRYENFIKSNCHCYRSYILCRTILRGSYLSGLCERRSTWWILKKNKKNFANSFLSKKKFLYLQHH